MDEPFVSSSAGHPAQSSPESEEAPRWDVSVEALCSELQCQKDPLFLTFSKAVWVTNEQLNREEEW